MEDAPPSADLSTLTPDERALYDDLRYNRLRKSLRLEQEHIGFDRVRSRRLRSATNFRYDLFLIMYFFLVLYIMGNNMPAKPPQISTSAASKLKTLGAELRQHRKRLGVSATVAAESAGMSRITWYRIEQGSPAVTAGAYMQACAVLGLNLELQTQRSTNEQPQASGNEGAWIPTRIKLADYPQLQQLAWHVRGANTFALTPRETLDIYERHGRHLDTSAMAQHEQELLAGLREVLGTTHGI